MANEVIKRDGSREPFDPEKIKSSIRKAAQKTDLPEERVNEVVEQVSKAAIELADSKEEIATSEIREKILSELDNVEPKVAESWRDYDRTKGEGEGETSEGETSEEGEGVSGEGMSEEEKPEESGESPAA